MANNRGEVSVMGLEGYRNNENEDEDIYRRRVGVILGLPALAFGAAGILYVTQVKDPLQGVGDLIHSIEHAISPLPTENGSAALGHELNTETPEANTITILRGKQ